MKFYITVACFIGFLLTVYYFSYQLQLGFAKVIHIIGSKVGTYSQSGELELKKYIFLHRNSVVSKLYWFLNDLIINLGMKMSGVTPLGFLVFWAIIALILSVFCTLILGLGFVGLVPLFFLLLTLEIILIRVSISEKIERREACIMDAVDLIIPEVRNGVKNAIMTQKQNFSPLIVDDFNEFETNVNQRKMSFNDAMMVLADSLGMLFRDFAQKAISFEQSGDLDMLDIFVEIIETNRLRRELRDINNTRFSEIRRDFLVSSALMIAYAFYAMMTDKFTRVFLTSTVFGKFLVIFMVADTIAVLAFISTIKSKSL